MAVRKATFSLDDSSLQMLQELSMRLARPRSSVLREAIAELHDRSDRLSDAEQERMLKAVERHIPQVPTRTQAEIDAEIEELRAVRHLGGRLHPAVHEG